MSGIRKHSFTPTHTDTHSLPRSLIMPAASTCETHSHGDDCSQELFIFLAAPNRRQRVPPSVICMLYLSQRWTPASNQTPSVPMSLVQLPVHVQACARRSASVRANAWACVEEDDGSMSAYVWLSWPESRRPDGQPRCSRPAGSQIKLWRNVCVCV